MLTAVEGRGNRMDRLQTIVCDHNAIELRAAAGDAHRHDGHSDVGDPSPTD